MAALQELLQDLLFVSGIILRAGKLGDNHIVFEEAEG